MNRLAQERSPYLKQHAENPVDWYPWGDEALARARAENRPILLSVGYSACHWCHVMAHESFENAGIAARMNELFVNIKLDREERPDLDQLYQGVVQLMGRGGGWPLTVFLTPDLRPFFGGTYFPPEDRHGLPAFPRLLGMLADAWKNRPQEVEQQARSFRDGLAQAAASGLEGAASEPTPRDILSLGQKLGTNVDPTYGGFGGAPKFPNPMNLALMLRAYRRGASELWAPVSLTLERMARGGIYDQLGGGFHRYSVDQRWLVPHFEKMLYDNGQLIHLYSEAQQIRPRPLWAKVVEETVEYVRREMTDPAGGFYAAQDADSEGEEGVFFVWRPEQLRAALSPDQAELLALHFNVNEVGNFEDGQTVLEIKVEAEDLARRLKASPEEIEHRLLEARRALFAARAQRIAPGRDDKVLSGWNGLMIRGLAFASRVFRRPEWAGLAARAGDFLLERMWKDGRLLRAYQDGAARIDGFIEDYGDAAAGLAALYQATFEPRFLAGAEEIARRAVELFWDESKQAYFSAPRGQKDLLCPTYAVHDNAFPSGASSLAEAQVALAALTGRGEHLEQAGKYLRKMRDEMALNPFAFGHLALAEDSYLDGAAAVVLAGDPDGVRPLVEQVNLGYAPTVSLAVQPKDSAAVLEEAMRGKQPVGGRAAAYVCRRFTCEAPLTDPAELRRTLETLSNR